MLKRHNTRAEGVVAKDDYVVECTFIVFNKEAEIGETENGTKIYEKILPEAVDLEENVKNRDVAVLWNHNGDKVLARTGNGSLKLYKDDEGVKGVFNINPEDPEALSCYQKIKSGLVYQNSFGFFAEEDDIDVVAYEDGLCQVVRKLDILEVSPCTFPVYKDTKASARNIENVAIKIGKKMLKEKIEIIRRMGNE